jgi:hypothetical protein
MLGILPSIKTSRIRTYRDYTSVSACAGPPLPYTTASVIKKAPKAPRIEIPPTVIKVEIGYGCGEKKKTNEKMIVSKR